MNQDEQHLNLLGVFHYVLAGLTALTSLIFVLHIVLGILLATGTIEPHNSEAQFAGFLVGGVGFLVMTLMAAFAALIAYAGYCLRQHKNHTFCVVVAALLCLNAPFGTILGVFTLIVLFRDSARELFVPSAA